MIRRPPRSTPLYSSAASDVYKRQRRRRRLAAARDGYFTSTRCDKRITEAQIYQPPAHLGIQIFCPPPPWTSVPGHDQGIRLGIKARVRIRLITDRVSTAGNAIASVCPSVCPSVRPSVCFHSIFGTDWSLTLNFCVRVGHDHSSQGICLLYTSDAADE